MNKTGLASRREMRPALAASLVAVALLATSCVAPPGPVRHTTTVKLDSALAHDTRRADALGLTPAAGLSTAPASRGDHMRWLDRAQPDVPPGEEEEPSLDEAWLASYVALGGYEDEIADQFDESEDRPWFSFDPVDDARLRYVVVDEPMKFYNEQGREFRKGSNFYLSNRSVARLFDRVVITADPEFSHVERDLPNEDSLTNLRFQELTASVRLGPGELTVGRQPLWWGPGRHGTLLVSNNARPFDLVKLSTAGNVQLPWYLSYLGLLRGEVFASRLDSARAVERPYFAGMRLTSRVLPWLELGAARTMQFGGGDRSVTGKTVWEVFTASTENDKEDPGNQIAAIDARIIVPWSKQPFEVYGEYGGEDEAGFFFSREAYLVGFYLPRILDWHALEFTAEFADTTVRSHPRTWYNNRNYPDGYTYHNQIIGHHVGTDGRDLFLELRVRPPILEERLSFALSYDYEEHFRLDPVEERLHQFRIAADFRAWKKLVLSAFFQHDEWRNFRQDRGRNATGSALGLGARWSF